MRVSNQGQTNGLQRDALIKGRCWWKLYLCRYQFRLSTGPCATRSLKKWHLGCVASRSSRARVKKSHYHHQWFDQAWHSTCNTEGDGGRKFSLTATQVMGLVRTMKDASANHRALAKELGIAKTTLFRYVSPTGELCEADHKVLQG